MPNAAIPSQKVPTTSHLVTDTVRTRSSKLRLDDKVVRAAKPPISGNRITYDARLPGFGLRVTASDGRSFIFNYRIKGRERRITIGKYPAWTVLAARKQAEHLRRQVDVGVDPLESRITEREAPTVCALFERYEKEHLPTKTARSAADDRAMWKNDILPALGAKKVVDLRPNDCDALHRAISETRPTRANRVNEVLRKALNLAIRWGWIDRNPASGVRRNPEPKRHRYLGREEVGRLVGELERHVERTSADAILLMLLTGCRKSEALNATWGQFDLNCRIWTKPSAETKQRREHRVPYSSAVARILKRRRTKAIGPYVFPGGPDAPLQDVRRTWAAACKASGLQNVRLHDLRHTFASLAASSGQSLMVVGELLGHSTPQTTKRYASLYDDTLRSAAEGVSVSLGMRRRRTVRSTRVRQGGASRSEAQAGQ